MTPAPQSTPPDLTALPSLEPLRSGAWIAFAGRLAAAVVIVTLAVVAARLLRRTIMRLKGRSRVSASSLYIVEKLVGYAVVAVGVFVALSTVGINLNSLAVFAGAVGVGVGLGLQGVVREFVSGLVIIFDPNVNVGDFVELEPNVRGEIVEVGPRATRIRTNDALDVVLPNSKLIENRVVNWTLRGHTRRIHVPFGVAYGSDKTKVREAVLKAAHALPLTSPDAEGRKTQVWMTGFGESQLNFELVVWPTEQAVRRPAATQAAYTWAIEDALRAAGLEMPFAQIDVRARSLFGLEDAEALAALGMKPRQPGAVSPPSAPPAEAAPPSTNDASADAQLARGLADPEGRAPVGPSPDQA